MSELLVGCGSRRDKLIFRPPHSAWKKLVTLDMNPDHKPDVVWDLTKRPLPFEDNAFDEIHAYDVLEHLGQQGDWSAWFAEWSEWWRLLKPNGELFGKGPYWKHPGAWADPGHSRLVMAESFTWLDQREYTKQVGITPMTDYRRWYKADFDVVFASSEDQRVFTYCLRAIKPSRESYPPLLSISD